VKRSLYIYVVVSVCVWRVTLASKSKVKSKDKTRQDVASEQRQQLLSLTWQLHVACCLVVALPVCCVAVAVAAAGMTNV